VLSVGKSLREEWGHSVEFAGLSQGESRVSEQVVDGEELGEGARFCVVFLSREHGIAESRVTLIEEGVEKRLMKTMRRLVQNWLESASHRRRQ